MPFPPFVFVVFTSIMLGLWFFRSRNKDASLWMYATYAGAFGLAFSHYSMMTTMEFTLPLVIRDFLLIGIAGFMQSLAVAKRISITTAVIGIFVVYVLVYLLPFENEPNAVSINNDSSKTEQSIGIENAASTPAKIFSTADPDGEYLIEKRAEASEEELSNWALANGYTISRAFTMVDTEHTLLDDYYVLNTDRADNEIYQRIMDSDLTSWVEDNETVQVELGVPSVPNARAEQPMVNDPEAGKQWAMESLEMGEYYRLLRQLKPVKKVKIAILDTGVDGGHEDIKDNYFTTQKKYDNDPRGHGTHCAGIAAGITDNGIGIASPAGLNGLVEITSIKVLSAGGAGTQKTIIQGMLEAVDSGVDIISMSLGGYSNSSRQRAYNQAISYARRYNVIVVAAAGNSNREASEFSPANGAGAICVAATDQLSLRAPFSNRVGRVKMAVAAPGVAIYSTFPGNNYKAFSGTSMACPFVAGVIAVLRSQQPELTTDQVYNILAKTGKRTTEIEQLGPIIQPVAALMAVID